MEWVPGSESVPSSGPERSEKKRVLLNSSLVFVNTGGTIVSAPRDDVPTGVRPLVDLPSVDPVLREFLSREDASYVDSVVKLSEEWTEEDYLEVREELKFLRGSGRDKFIFTHGTDCVSFFAPWIDLLSKELDFKGVILIAQRSWDRPTSEFHPLLERSLSALDRLKRGNSVVLTHREDGDVLVHNPYQIRKFHTTAMEGFYSTHSMLLSKRGALPRTEFLRRHRPRSEVRLLRPPTVLVQTMFTRKERAELRVSRGVGNFKQKWRDEFSGTIVGSGPMNQYLYNGGSRVRLCVNELDFTWESLYVISAFTDEDRS